MNPPCCASAVLGFTSDVVIFPGIWRREPPADVLLQFIAYEVVSNSQRSWSAKAPLRDNSRFDLFILLESFCISSDGKSDNWKRLILIRKTDLEPPGYCLPIPCRLDLEVWTFIHEK